jgi:hypothetical protein
VLDDFRRPDPDPSHAAACERLLRHLVESSMPLRGYRLTGTTSSKIFAGN